VADAQDNQIRVFSPTGVIATRVGRTGSGPLEFKGLSLLAFGPDRHLWARDEGNARLLVFDVSRAPARNVRTVPLTTYSGGSRAAIVFEPDGANVDESITFDARTQRFLPLRLKRTTAGAIVRTDTLREPPEVAAGLHRITKEQKDAAGKIVGMSQALVSQPYGPMWLRAYGPGGVRAEAVSTRYEVRVIGADGRLLRTLRRALPPVPLSTRERQAAEKQLDERVATHGATRSALPFGVPRTIAPVTALVWARDGALWVERAVADGAPAEADVYDAAGRLVAVAELPRGFQMRAAMPFIDGRTAYGVVRDSLDVESVVRVRFR
jgi:hypothetical protein